MLSTNIKSLLKALALAAVVLLTGCAANQMPGFQNTYQGYNVPDALVQNIRAEFIKHKLPNAQIKKDLVGRIQLTGSFYDENEVDRAFIIISSIVGLKSTSPFYPENVKNKQWEKDATQALARYAAAGKSVPTVPVKRALIIGINDFQDKKIPPVLGEDDAKRVLVEADRAGYKTTALLGSQATKANIENAIRQLRTELKPVDSLFIYISSHGEQPHPSPQGSDARKMSIITYDTRAGDGTRTDVNIRVHETALPDTVVQDLAQMPTKQTYVLIDTCYSGEILKGVTESEYILKTNGGVPERASITMSNWSNSSYTAKGIFMTTEETQKNVTGKPTAPVAWNKEYGIITATSDGEKSWGPNNEIKKFKSNLSGKEREVTGSFFTQYFMDSLEKNNGNVQLAFVEAKDATRDKVKEVPAKQIARMVTPTDTGKKLTIF